MIHADPRCRCCPTITAICIGSGLLLCISPNPAIPGTGSPVGRRNGSPPVSVAAADTNSDPSRGYMGRRLIPALGTSAAMAAPLSQLSDVGCLDVTGGESAATNSFDDLAPTIAELEAAWLLQPGVSELRIAKNGSAPSLVSRKAPLIATADVAGEPASVVALSSRRDSKNVTMLRATAENLIQSPSSSSDIFFNHHH